MERAAVVCRVVVCWVVVCRVVVCRVIVGKASSIVAVAAATSPVGGSNSSSAGVVMAGGAESRLDREAEDSTMMQTARQTVVGVAGSWRRGKVVFLQDIDAAPAPDHHMAAAGSADRRTIVATTNNLNVLVQPVAAGLMDMAMAGPDCATWDCSTLVQPLHRR